MYIRFSSRGAKKPAHLSMFGKKKAPINCAVCGRELGRHRYKPAREWNMGEDLMLCGGCHVEKTKEFMLRQQEAEAAADVCAMCKKEIAEGAKASKPRWQWEMEAGSLLCQTCYEKKDAEFNKKLNYCALCGAKIGIIRYNPKPAWKVEGQLCRKCWDGRNAEARK